MALGSGKRGRGIINAVGGKKEQKNASTAKTPIKKQANPDRRIAMFLHRLIRCLNSFYFEMNEEETNTHMMRLVYHMLVW